MMTKTDLLWCYVTSLDLIIQKLCLAGLLKLLVRHKIYKSIFIYACREEKEINKIIYKIIIIFEYWRLSYLKIGKIHPKNKQINQNIYLEQFIRKYYII